MSAGLDQCECSVDALANKCMTLQNLHSFGTTGDGCEQRWIAAVLGFRRVHGHEPCVVWTALDSLDRAADVQGLDWEPGTAGFIVDVLHENPTAVDRQGRVDA
jgi:hypothetical protein